MSARLIPPTTELTLPYWTAAQQHKLVLQQCPDCGVRPFPPRAHCPDCGAGDLHWQPVSGRGHVYTFTVAHRPPHRVFSEQCPLVLAVVELAEGPRMMTNIIGCDPTEVAVDMPVQVDFDPIDDSDLVLPVFSLLEARQCVAEEGRPRELTCLDGCTSYCPRSSEAGCSFNRRIR